VVAVLVFLEQRRYKGQSPVALPLGILALDVFAWNFFEFAYLVSGEPTWHYLDLSFSPYSPLLVLLVVASFTGDRRKLRPLFAAGGAVFGALSAGAIVALFVPAARHWVDASSWSATFGITETVLGAVALALLVRHLFRISDRNERQRTALVILALVVGVALTTTDLWNAAGYAVPALGSLGTLIGMALITIATLRFEFLGQSPGLRRSVVAITIAAGVVVAYLVAFRSVDGNHALLSITIVTAIVVMATRELVTMWVTRKNRMQSLATLGKFSAQMAHDLQNPLAAIKGTVQFLREEIKQGRPLTQQGNFLDLVENQIDRMNRVIGDYRRIGRAEPVCRSVDINETVRSVLALQTFAARNLEIHADLAESLPACKGDPDLLSVAFENVVRNAAEAMSQGGRLTVRTAMAKRFGIRRSLVLSVQDTGAGMDARQLERAFDLFYTTKASGTGLGLPYVRRVISAHGGRVQLVSRADSGTTVTIRLPLP